MYKHILLQNHPQDLHRSLFNHPERCGDWRELHYRRRICRDKANPRQSDMGRQSGKIH